MRLRLRPRLIHFAPAATLAAAVLAASVSPDFVAKPGGQVGTVSAVQTSYVTAEGATVQVAVTVTTPTGAPLEAPVTVGYTTGGGSATAWLDYRPASGALVFAAGARSGITQTFPIRILCDDWSESPHTLSVSLSSGTIGVRVDPRQPEIVIVPTHDSLAPPPQAARPLRSRCAPASGRSGRSARA
jgi:beta-glucosidase